ncbi:hypothetical protein J6590_076519 [Homalodisca vitripennis]|nr:hypothetical protein J6590_076519 [Homalodisca vitripennis]
MESFLEDLNNILNSGDVPNIYQPEDLDKIFQSMKGAVTEQGLAATKANLMAVYLKAVRSNLHCVLTMSPIGEIFRARLRQFPALVNCCTIDWFTAWPDSALQSVAERFLDELPELEISKVLEQGIVTTFQYMHQSVVTASEHYLQGIVTTFQYMHQRVVTASEHYLHFGVGHCDNIPVHAPEGGYGQRALLTGIVTTFQYMHQRVVTASEHYLQGIVTTFQYMHQRVVTASEHYLQQNNYCSNGVSYAASRATKLEVIPVGFLLSNLRG